HQNGFPMQKVDCTELARYGHLECLKWAVANGHRVTKKACVAAAGMGHLSVLRWLHEEAHCEWDGDTLAEALSCRHWELFEWARKHGCPANSSTRAVAEKRGYAEILQWVYEFY